MKSLRAVRAVALLLAAASASFAIGASAGTDPEATGLDNIYLRGAILGLRKKHVAGLVDDIAKFSDLGDLLHLPVKTYSAGMKARLTFAISTATQHDILLIDEGIGVGDASFQEKAHRRIEDHFSRTSIIILASHSEDLLKKYCNRRITLSKGKLVGDEPIS